MSVDYTVYTDTSRIQKIFAYSRIYQQELWEKHFIRRMIADNYTALLGLWISCRIRPGAWEAVLKTLLCGTSWLGYDEFLCPRCGDWNILYHKCHSFFCPSCGVKAQKLRAANAKALSVDARHRHIVFTIPEEYRTLFMIDDRACLGLLFTAARNTIYKTANQSLYKRLKNKNGGKLYGEKDCTYLFRNIKGIRIPGFIAAIHTFGRDLKWNPHIHVCLAEALWDSGKERLLDFHHINFASLRKTWMYEINRLLSLHFRDREDVDFDGKFKNPSYRKYPDGYYVYARYSPDAEAEDAGPRNAAKKKKKEDNSESVQGLVSYMMRYSCRPAMAESRITSYDSATKNVKWWYDDHATGDRVHVEEPALELLKKMIMHIPDKGFRTVRYYGFYSQKGAGTLDKVNGALGMKGKKKKDAGERRRQKETNRRKCKYRTMCIDSFNRDPLKCGCGAVMAYRGSWIPDGMHKKGYWQKAASEYIETVKKLSRRPEPPPPKYEQLHLSYSMQY